MVHSPEMLELYDEAERYLILAFLASGVMATGVAYLLWRLTRS